MSYSVEFWPAKSKITARIELYIYLYCGEYFIDNHQTPGIGQ